MKFSKEEVMVIWYALHNDREGKPKVFLLSQLKDASKIVEQVKEKCLAPEDEKGNRDFLEGELEFSTDEKKLIRDVTDREWDVGAGASVLSLRDKLA